MITDAESRQQQLPINTPSQVLMLGIILGFAADRLVWPAGPASAGFFLWMTLFVLATLWLVLPAERDTRIQTAIWSGVALAAAIFLSIRNTPVVIVAMLLVMLAAMVMVYLRRDINSVVNARVLDFIVSLIRVPLHSGLGVFSLLQQADIGKSISRPRLWSAMRGFLLGLPVCIIFLLLFSSADAGFSRLAREVLDVFAPETLQHLIFAFIIGWLSAGMLAGVCFSRFPGIRLEKPLIKLGTDDTAVLMGSVVMLFLLFVYLQLGYLFGGSEAIESTTGLTLAQYARRGFFELLAVAGLTLVLLVCLAGSGCNPRIFRPLAATLLGCVLVILASAIQRLYLYIDAFGLTLGRVTALAIMLWLVVTMGLFAITMLLGRTRYFIAGATVAGMLIAIMLALLSPAAVVARINMERSAYDNRDLDVNYLLALGSDAVPVLIENLQRLPEPIHCDAVARIAIYWYPTLEDVPFQIDGWRSWNASVSRAHRQALAFRPMLMSQLRSCNR